jgi:hypothetical protein
MILAELIRSSAFLGVFLQLGRFRERVLVPGVVQKRLELTGLESLL